jgi:hypothetical protein
MKSIIFSNYNKMRKEVEKASKPHAGRYDTGRLNRGLGRAQAKEDRPYYTTVLDCSCRDRHYRGVVCKHMLAKRMSDPRWMIDPIIQIKKGERELLAELGF